MNRIPYQQGQRAIFWPLALLPLVLAFAAYRISSQHIESVEATLATDEFLRDVDELQSTVQEAETGQRGYLLTGQARYLAPFTEARSKISARLSRVDEAAAGNAVPREKVGELHMLINQKMAELDNTVDLRRRAGLPPALAIVESGHGQAIMTQIRAACGALKQEQTVKFQQRLEQQRIRQLELDVVLAIGVGLGFALVFWAYQFNSHYVQQRDRVENEIRHLNETLEERVKERTLELEMRSAELQRSNADLAQFAYVASHDLQEPLRMVGSYMGLLERRYAGVLDENAKKYIEFAVGGAHRMQALINDLLSYSRVGTQPVEKRLTSSMEIVQQAVTNLEVTIAETSAVVHFDGLPVICADETKLTQVMQNLIGNAIKFRKPDARPEVWVTARRTGPEWLFAVADNGIGFDPKYCDRIFQVFQRLHGVGKYPGNGIGLAICRRIVEHHGGRLWADSQPGVGSTFFFTMPIAGEKSRPESQQKKRKAEGATSPVTHV